MIRLKPCPRCGSGEVAWNVHDMEDYGQLHVISCCDCGIRTRLADTHDGAIADWNTRPDGWVLTSERWPDKDRPVIGEHGGGSMGLFIVVQVGDELCMPECYSLWYGGCEPSWRGEFEDIPEDDHPKRWRYILPIS